MTRILIADDHHMYNEGLNHILSKYFCVVAQVFHGRDVISEILKHSPELVFLDINLSGINGLDIAKRIKSDYPNIKIIFLSMYNEDVFIKTAKNLGASAYLLKESSGEQILEALQQVLEGKSVFPQKVDERNLHQQDMFVKNLSLTKREIEIIILIKQGFSTPEIANKMCLSFETIKSHRKNIFYKLNINKVSDLITFAIENGIT